MRLLPLLAALALAGCAAEREVIETRLSPVRTYGWPSDVVDPEPDWNPARPILLARCRGGFCLLEEGGKGVQRFAAEDRKESFFPRWLNPEQLVFGPAVNATRTSTGHVVHPSDGLTVVTIGEASAPRRMLADRGFQPRPDGQGRVWAQALDRIITIGSHGEVDEFGEGFDPQPQPDGPGLAWRDTPAFTADWWTGKTGPGMMHVRWSPGTSDDVPGAMQAAWTRAGGAILTVVDNPPAAKAPWWSGGTRLVHLAGPGSTPVTLRNDARDPAPHPLAELLAWTSNDGGIWIGTIRSDGWSERVATAASRPRWSTDGRRLCWLADPTPGTQTPAIRVAVLAPPR